MSYFDVMASYLDGLRKVQSEIRSKISFDVKLNINDAKYRTYIGIAIVVVVLLVSPIIILLVKNATNTIQVSIHRFSRFYRIEVIMSSTVENETVEMHLIFCCLICCHGLFELLL